MKKSIIVTIAVLSLVFRLVSAQTNGPFVAPKRGFVSWLPAASWEHSLLSGNGTMGALVIGHPHQETAILSHALLYLPTTEPKIPINQASRLEEIRRLLLAGKYEEAAKIPLQQREKEGFWTGRDPFIPGFDLKIEQQPSNIKRYIRSVNYENGETNVSWEDNIGIFQRKLFVSRSDSVIVLSIKGTGKISCKLHFEHRPVEWNQWQFVGDNIGSMDGSAEGQWLTYRSEFKKKYKNGLQGYEGVGRLILKGGTSKIEGNRLVITDADEVLLLIKIDASYDYSKSHIPQLKQYLSGIQQDYNALLNRHAKIHGEIFNRVSLDLNGTNDDRSLYTEELIHKTNQQVPAAMIEKAFDAGRYNILCVMGTNPPNLQGIWSGTWTAPWSSDFTHDGNVQSAIASALSGNMPELMKAYFNYHEKQLPQYRDNAKLLYGTRGIHIPAHTSTNGLDTDFGTPWCLTLWTGGAGWTSQFYYDYWQYTGDKKFLTEKAYPFMKEAALFYEDFVTLGQDGKYVFNPSYSPENNPANGNAQACVNATMDVMIAKQLFRNCISAAKTLHTDKEKIKLWEAMIAKMPAYEVNKDGTLREWLWPGMEENYKHRHASHLYGLYDETDPDIANNPVLIQAVNRAIEERMKFRQAEGGGEMAFGLVQLALSAAHIGEAEKAYEIINWLSSKYWSTGMGSFHNVGNLFNTDISGGLPASIIQMLAYSERGLVSLLPALPKAWPKGKIEGILLRGQIAIKSLSWDGKNLSVVLHSTSSQEVKLKVPGEIKSIYKNGKILMPRKGKSLMVTLQSGEDASLVIELK